MKKISQINFFSFQKWANVTLTKNSTAHIGFAVTLVDKKVLRKRTCIVYYILYSGPLNFAVQ